MATCKRCGQPLPTVADAAGQLKCGQCGASYGVLRSAPPTREPLFDDDDFFAPPPPPRPRPEDQVPQNPAPDVDPQRLLEHRLRAERPELPAPTWTFFSGVFTFPFYRSVLSRWLIVSAGMIAFSLLDALVRYGLEEGGLTLVMTGFLTVGAGTMFVVVFGYVGKLFWAIVNGTGDGQDEIVDWGEANWKEWIWPLLWLVYLLFAALAVGYGVGRLLETDSGQPAVVSLWGLFPIILLSSIDSNSPLGLISWPIARSWRTCWWGWLAFYGLSGVLLSGYYWAARWLGSHLLAGLLVEGPLLAAVVFIYARLIGRLAWAAGMSGAWDRPEDEDGPAAGR